MANRGQNGTFRGYRKDCEEVPCLPAHVVARYLTDPRRTPYLLIWTCRLPIDRLFGGSLADALREAVRLGPFSFREGEAPEPGWVEVKHWNGKRTGLQVLERPLPRNGGKAVLLACDRCRRPCRALYGWRIHKELRCVTTGTWNCRTCSRLSYSSEGGALVYRSRWAVTRPLSGLRLIAKPDVWEPLVFADPVSAARMGLCGIKTPAADRSSRNLEADDEMDT